MSPATAETTHAQSLKRLYDAWLAGDVASIERDFPPKLTFEIKGGSRVAAKHDRAGFARLMGQMKELTGGAFSLKIHDLLASDRHGMVLSTVQLTRDGQPSEYRTVHVWRFEEGLPIAGYEYLRDQAQFDRIWA